MLLPPPDISANYVDEKSGRPSKDFFNWIKSLDSNVRGISGIFFNVKDVPYSAKGDGVTNDTDAIIAAIDAAVAVNGGTVYFPPGTYLISETIEINNSNIALIGAGADGTHDGGSGAAPATILQWDFAAAALPMVKFFTPSSAGASVIGACQVRGITLDGNNKATRGLVVQSVRHSVFDHIYIYRTEEAGVYITTDPVIVAEARNTQRCLFRNIQWRFFESTSPNVIGMVLTGQNTSFNIFESCVGQNVDGNSWELIACDNNLLFHCGGQCVGTGKSFNIHGYDTANNTFADSNVFYGCGWAPGGCVLLGTDSGFNFGTTDNIFYAIDTNNASDYPVPGVGCRAYAQKQNGETPWTRAQAVNVANLPATVTQGLRAMVNNATATTFNSIVAGGGGNTVPVFYDGTNWRIG